MGKVKQRNWLIIITIFLVIVSGLGLFLSMRQKLSFNSCAYGEEIYKSGDEVPNYSGRSDCTCNSDGTIKCGSDTSTSGYDGFSSTNLSFTYSYLNLLDSSSIMKENPISSGASYINGTLIVKFERNVLCASNSSVPAQSGFYQISTSMLKLMIMTNKDTSQYTYPCRIEDVFKITGLDMALDNGFQVYYQNENGESINLGACIYNNVLYGDQEAFKSQDSTSVCLCNSGKISCKTL